MTDDATNSDSANREQELEAVIADYIRACEAGGAPDRRQILNGHPQLAADLRQFFAQRDRMHQMAAPIRDFSDDLFQSVGPGQQISYVGNYELLEEVARGGMGVVYKARQVNLGRIVAVKMIMAGRLASDDDVKRFHVEAEAVAGLQHPHIVSIHEVGQHEGWHYFSMDFVSGRDLSAILREKLLTARQAAKYVHQMAAAIHYAHQQGTLHRDLKPSNVMIDNLDQVRITDFGLAVRVESHGELTRTGQIVGTPSYMPPEQAQGKRSLIGAASDVYSLGAVLYECLTGRPPFRAESVVETIQQVIQSDPVAPRLLNPGIPRDLETICVKCLQKEPHRRYGSAKLLADDLQRFLDGQPITARRISRPYRAWRWCRRNPVVASLSGAVVAFVFVTSLAAVSIRQAVLHRQQVDHAKTLVIKLMHADSAKVPAILAEVERYGRIAEPILTEQFGLAADHSTEKLHLGLALIATDANKAAYLCDEMLTVNIAQFPMVRDALLPPGSPIVESLWTIATDSHEEGSRRFQAACALATFVPDDERWQSVSSFVAERLVALEASELVGWRMALRPARKRLVSRLADIYRDSSAHEQARIYAAETLADFSADSSETLFALLADAEPYQFAVIFKALQKHRDEVTEFNVATLSTLPTDGSSDDEKETSAKRRANAAIALYRLGAADKVWPLLQHSHDPRARSDFIHWLAARGGEPHALVQRLDVERDVTIRRALVLALGEFTESQLPLTERLASVAKLLHVYENEPDAGLHAAVEWLLRKWGHRDALQKLEEKLMGELPSESQQWYVNLQGQTFVILEPAEFNMGSPLSEQNRHVGELPHRHQLGHRFAIASHEVTQAQHGASTVPAVKFARNSYPADLPRIATWYQATAYCNWLSHREGLPADQWCYVPNSAGQYAAGMRAKPKACELSGYRLPTEAEWEYACRAGTVTSRFYGAADALLPHYAWYQLNQSNQLRPIGLLKPNDSGLFDALGNAYEWCHDPYQPYSESPIASVENALYEAPVLNNVRRVLRGGAFNEHPFRIRSASRSGNVPEVTGSVEGFRPARTYRYPTTEQRANERSLEPLTRDIRWLRVSDERAVAAAERLGAQGLKAIPAIPALFDAMNDHGNGALQLAAGRALGHIGPAAASILVKAAANSNAQLRSVANQGLVVLEQRPGEAATAIREQLRDADNDVRRAAVLALRRLAGEPGVIEDLRERLKDQDPGVRHAATYILGLNSTRAEAAIPSLIDVLADKHPIVARAASAALARVGPTSKAVIDALIAVSQGGDQDQRGGALAALGEIGPAAEASLQIEQDALSDDSQSVRIVARQAFRRIAPALAETQIGPPYDPVKAGQHDRASLKVGPGDWPQWGGSRFRNNTPFGQNIPTDWDPNTGKNIKWAAKLGSQSYGNPAVANGKIFIGTNNGNGYLKRFPAKIDLGVMLCFEEATGKFLWQHSSPKLPTGRVHDWPEQGMPSTPVVDGDRLWAVTNRCEVVCLDTEGFHDAVNDGPYCSEPNESLDEADVVWRFDMMQELRVSPHNMSNCSILIADGVLFVCTSNGVDEGHINIPSPNAPSFVAMDRETGEVIWTDNSPGLNILHGQWASPSYVVIGGQAQVIFAGGDGWVYSFDPKGDGQGGSRLLWKFDANPKESIYLLGGRATRNHVIAFPAIYDDLVYITVGEDPEHGEGVGHLWCINPAHAINGSDVSEHRAVDAAGQIIPHRRLQAVDIKLGEHAVTNPNSAVCWHYSRQDRNADGRIDFEEQFHRSIGTPAIKDDILYVADFAGLVHCLNAKTGGVYWTHDMYAACWGSALLVDDKVFLCDEDGDVAIFRHSADPSIALPNGTPFAEISMPAAAYATPIVANNVLYIATKDTLYAIETSPKLGIVPPRAASPAGRVTDLSPSARDCPRIFDVSSQILSLNKSSNCFSTDNFRMNQTCLGPIVASSVIAALTSTIRGRVLASTPVTVSISLVTLVMALQIAARQVDAQVAQKRNTVPFDAVAAGQQDRKTLRVGPDDWPQWGGSRLRNNTPIGKNIPTDWDIESGHNIKWAAKLGSQTYGNPSVANGKVFIGTNNGNGYLKRYPTNVDLGVMLCFEEATGKFLWQFSSPKLPTGRVNDWPMQGMPSTPVVDGDRVWAVTNRCEVICIDTEGFRDGENDGPYRAEPNENLDEADIVWRFDMLNDLGVFPHNMSNCSMLIADGVLFVCTSNGVDEAHVKIPKPDAPSFVAMDCDTGKVLWKDNSPGSNILHGQWASPSYAVIGGQPQVIFPGGDGWVYSFDPKGNGLGGSQLLWKFDANPKESIYILGGRSTRNHMISFATIYDGLVYIAVGEDPEHGEGIGHLWCIDPSIAGEDLSECLAVDAAGNVLPPRRLQAVDVKKGERTVANPNSAVRWHYSNHDQNGNGKIDFTEQLHRSLATPAIKDDLLYLTDIAGLVHCLNARTGDVHWTHDLFASSWGSALIVDDKVYIGDEDGKVSIFCHSSDPGIALPNRVPLAELTLVDSIYSTPIVANNVLYIATKNTLYAMKDEPEDGPDRNAIQVVKNSIEMELVLVPAGKFRMGEKGSGPGTSQQVDVTLSNAFYMGKTEVTQGQWKALMSTTPWNDKSNIREGDNYPATFVSWDDAKAFCAKLSEKEKVTYRLPTEAQWEYACRSRATTRYSFGDDEGRLGDYAWWGANSPLGNTKAEQYAHEVGKKRANRFGLHDMYGNVWEWCEDLHVRQPAGGIDPRVFDGGLNRVFRGGSWDTDATKCRSAFRFANLPWGPKSDLGFRVVRDKDATEDYRKESIPIRSLAGHQRNIVTMAVFSPDGEIVASTSEDGTAVLWSWQERTSLHVLSGHSAGVLFAAFSPDGKTLATGGRDSKVILWDVETGTLRTVIDDHTGAVSAVLYSEDGTTLFTGSSDKAVKVRESNGKLRLSLAGHQQEVIALARSTDGKTLVSAGGNWHAPALDGEVKVWDLQTGTTRWTAAGEFGGIWSVAISPDGKQLAGASLDGTVRIWDFASGQPLAINKKHTDRVLWVAYEPGSQLLTSSGLDGQMYYWEADKLRGNQVTNWNNHRVQRFSYSARKKMMATAGGDGTTTIWRLPDAVVPVPPVGE